MSIILGVHIQDVVSELNSSVNDRFVETQLRLCWSWFWKLQAVLNLILLNYTVE
jgi:hypothetical protein